MCTTRFVAASNEREVLLSCPANLWQSPLRLANLAQRHTLSLAGPIAGQKRIAAKPTQEHPRGSEAVRAQKTKDSRAGIAAGAMAPKTSQADTISGGCFAGDSHMKPNPVPERR